MTRRLATASQIQAEMQQRIDSSAELGDEARELLKAPMPYMRSQPDHTGCNWSVPAYRGPERLERFIAALVREAQAQYNLHR